MTDLYTLFFENLQDAIASVRQGAALALANVVRAYGEWRGCSVEVRVWKSETLECWLYLICVYL